LANRALNSFPTRRSSDLIRTYKVSQRHDGQWTYYDPGVGTMPEPWEKTQLAKRLSMLGGLIFGNGLFDNISDAYRFLMLNYEPGDRKSTRLNSSHLGISY